MVDQGSKEEYNFWFTIKDNSSEPLTVLQGKKGNMFKIMFNNSLGYRLEYQRRERITEDLKLEYAVLWTMIFNSDSIL